MFEYSSPEQVGVGSGGIARFLEDMKRKHLHMHAMMILRHGKVVFEGSFPPWSKDNKHMLFSLSKSFTSTAVGFAVQDGLLKTSDRLIDFFPEKFTGAPCEYMQKITVKHLLTMNTGHKEEPQRDGDDWEAAFLRSYIEYEPGTHFMYNTYGTFMLSAIVQKVTGKKLVEYLKEKLFIPLGMSKDIWTEESPSGVATGGYGLNVRIADVAKLGQFYLQNGRWEGRQLLNEQWIKDAQTPWSDNSSRGTDSDWGQGYGYQFWMCRPDKVFRGDGAFGQYCIVCPLQDMVIAINSGVTDMGAVMQSIWDNILPTVDAANPKNGAEALQKCLAASATNAAWEEAGETVCDPVPEEDWLGRIVFGQTPFGLSALNINKDGLSLCFGEHDCRVPLVKDVWQRVQLDIGKENDPVGLLRESALRAARTKDGLILHFCHTLTPFEDVLRIKFAPHGATLKWHRNVGFGDSTDFEIIGMKA